MNEEKSPAGQVKINPSPAKNRLTYPDLLRIEWIVGDEIEEWKCRNDGGEGLVEKGQSTLEHICAMIREDEQIGDAAAAAAKEGGAA